MAKADAKKAPKDASKKDKKGKKDKQEIDEPTAGPATSVARHPKATDQVRRVKGFAGLAGFVGAAALSYQANVPPLQVGLRALGVGVACFLVAWFCAVTVWRVLVSAELRAHYEELYPPPPPESPSVQAGVPPMPAGPAPS
jgi:hypothetical protein